MNNAAPQGGRRLAFVGGLAAMLLGCAIFFLLSADSGSANINIDIDQASWPIVLGWFLAADGLISFLVGLAYIAFKIPRLQRDPALAELAEMERANLSAAANQEARQQREAAYRRVWRLGLTFMAIGLISLVAAVLVLNGVIAF